MAKKLLIERWSPTICEAVEGEKKPGVLLTIKGCVSGWKKNRNGRTYPRRLWEKAINADFVREQMALKNFYGECDHPEDRLEPCLQLTSHSITEFEFDDTNEELIAKIDILDTPTGNILANLYKYSHNLSFSTRGTGDVLPGGEVDPDTYEMFAIDAVCRPSYPTATVSELSEGEKLIKESFDALKDVSDDEVIATINGYKNNLAEQQLLSKLVDMKLKERELIIHK